MKVNAGQLERELSAAAGTNIIQGGFKRIQQPLTAALQTEPPQSHKKQPFKTERQRRAFFAMLRSGQITVPYRRTGKLKNSWQVRLELRGTEVGLSFTNSVPYAEMVVGRNQAAYHRGNWYPAEGILRKWEPRVQAAINDAANEWARGLKGGY